MLGAALLTLLSLARAEPAAATRPPPPAPRLDVTPRDIGPIARFTDADGAHVVTFTLKDAPASKEAGEDAKSRTLTVTHDVTRAGATKPTRLWEAKDFVLDCPFDVTLELLPDALRLTDLDGDGQHELSFAYALSCKSDVSPDAMKLLLYEGATKYALRGERPVAGAIDDDGKPVRIGGGAPQADPAFKTAPSGFLPWAEQRFRALSEASSSP